MKNKLDRQLSLLINNTALLLGLLMALFSAYLLHNAIFTPKGIGIVDFGEYDTILLSLGLSHTDATLQSQPSHYFNYVVETFKFIDFPYGKVLAPSGASTLLYPVVLVRLLVAPWGLDLSLAHISYVYIAMIASGVYLITRYAYRWLRAAVLIPCVFFALLFTDPGFAAHLHSLYPQGMAMASFFLLAGFTLRAAARREKGGLAGILAVAISGMLFYGALPELVIMLPLVFLLTLSLAWYAKPEYAKRLPFFLVTIAVLLWGSSGAVQHAKTNSEVNGLAPAYLSTFHALLPNSPDPVADLAFFGLDASYLPDVGLSYYEAEEAYAHNPRVEPEYTFLTNALSLKNRILFYIKNPTRMVPLLEYTLGQMNAYFSTRVLPADAMSGDGAAKWLALSIGSAVRRIVYPTGAGSLMFIMGMLALGCLVAIIWPDKKRSGRRMAAGCLLLFAISCMLVLPLRIILVGFSGIERYKATFMLLLDAGLCIVAALLVHLAFKAIMALGKVASEDSLPAYGAWPWLQTLAQRLGKAYRTIAASPRTTFIIVAVVAVFMTSIILFVPPRSGNVNNGDYGRMMEQMDLRWQPEILYDYEAQAGKVVIEEFEFTQPFNFKKLTTLQPVYSLIYPLTIVRGFCALTGLPFRTNYLSFVFALATLACLLSIARDLYGFYGKWTLPTALLLTAMLLGEIYLVWFNSLFGEGSIYLGIVMVFACSMRLVAVPRGKGLPYLVALAFASRFLLASKAQMLLALPGCLLLMVAFFIYHMPKDKLKRVLSGRHTNWQSVFYGLLMISDDPIADMEELGIDTRMAPDIGKHAYYNDEDYVFPPISPEADLYFHNNVNIMDIIAYYLRHPVKMFDMLNYSAVETVYLHDGFMAYVGERYDILNRKPVERFSLWKYVRPIFSSSSFWGYVVIYGAMLVLGFLYGRKCDLKHRLLLLIYLAIMMIGVLQFPLSAFGNGFADSNKQLFAFKLCHDFIIILVGIGACKVLMEAWATHVAKKQPIPLEASTALPIPDDSLIAPEELEAPTTLSEESPDEERKDDLNRQ